MTAGSTALRPAARAATVYRMELKDLTPTPAALAEAREIVNVSGTHDGYCVLLGLSHDGLVEALLQQTQMQVVVVDADRTKVLPFARPDRGRRLWTAHGSLLRKSGPV